MHTAPDAHAAPDRRALLAALARYHEPDARRSILEIVITIVPLVAFWFLTWRALEIGYGVSLLLAVPAAGFLVRLFMIQHDCGHGAFFQRRALNDWIGRVIGVLTLTPYDYWRQTHAIHHAGSGNLDRRGWGDVDTLTVREYLARSRFDRLRYRLYRHPLVLFGIGPAWHFILQQRLPIGLMRRGVRPWASALGTNVAIAALAALLIWAVGLVPFLLVHLPIMLLAAAAGVWLFYVQHQFEHTYWDYEPDWDRHEAALRGSSHYDLPRVLRWFTANIGVHHVHHLCSRIPFYHLPAALTARPELAPISRLTLWQSLACVHLTLWDEQHRRLISFRECRGAYGV